MLWAQRLSDVGHFACRGDIKRTFEANAPLTTAVCTMLDNVENEFSSLMHARGYLAT